MYAMKRLGTLNIQAYRPMINIVSDKSLENNSKSRIRNKIKEWDPDFKPAL
jgi:hypothetical protein